MFINCFKDSFLYGFINQTKMKREVLLVIMCGSSLISDNDHWSYKPRRNRFPFSLLNHSRIPKWKLDLILYFLHSVPLHVSFYSICHSMCPSIPCVIPCVLRFQVSFHVSFHETFHSVSFHVDQALFTTFRLILCSPFFFFLWSEMMKKKHKKKRKDKKKKKKNKKKRRTRRIRRSGEKEKQRRCVKTQSCWHFYELLFCSVTKLKNTNDQQTKADRTSWRQRWRGLSSSLFLSWLLSASESLSPL